MRGRAGRQPPAGPAILACGIAPTASRFPVEPELRQPHVARPRSRCQDAVGEPVGEPLRREARVALLQARAALPRPAPVVPFVNTDRRREHEGIPSAP